ncbi:MAG: metallophosphoesterase family protein, partial [Gammaproteobacteria bacterium]|nr:metallophosphoesterase family protein [Gammaproteobacteria bacterium]
MGDSRIPPSTRARGQALSRASHDGHSHTSPITRREFLQGAGVAIASPLALARTPHATPAHATPEQIHLTWGDDPARAVFVSWASAAQALNPRVILQAAHGGPSLARAAERRYTDGMNGQTVFTYHARLDGLHDDTAYSYEVTADNDAHKGDPFTATFRTAPRGRAAFRWTSYGDLATPVMTWTMSSPHSHHAVDAVERFQPLFHLLNGDLCYANLNTDAQPAVWADFGNNVQRSAANRPWMPCPGNHEIEFGNGAQGLDAYLTRYTLPQNGTAFAGRWYSFRVGSALFISLAADDVIYQDSGAFHPGPGRLFPAPGGGLEPIAAGTSLYIRGFSGGAQTRWLEQTLARAQEDSGIDWIIVQMHQDALSSSRDGNGSDRGIRESWLPLFDRYGVDLVLCGHDHDYERSWPVRGCNRNVGRDASTGAPRDTCQPRPVLMSDPADGRFDTSRGTIHLVLGGGGTSTPTASYLAVASSGMPQAKVITRTNRPMPGPEPGVFVRHGADALEDAVWSARRDTVTGYGIGVFDLEPGEPNGSTTITMRYYHAARA